MQNNYSTPWHKISWDTFIQSRLPELLAERLPLAGYRVDDTTGHTCRVEITLTASDGDDVTMTIDSLPQPNAEGVFHLDGKDIVVVPIVNNEDLAHADIDCVGEQLYNLIEPRLGHAPADLPWDAALAQAWLPLNSWVMDFLTSEERSTQIQDGSNWLSRATHLRRIIIPERESVIHPSELGRVCPFETPEGPNIGHVMTVAMGATIQDGKLVIVDASDSAKLGLTTSMVPLLEHNDSNRILMGVNMMRQWVEQSQPEAALVQTGNEPEDGSAWSGRNLLTTFVAWGPKTYEDGIIISESCAQRFDSPYPLQVGDKMSNRHGTKGVVSQILPDDAMPHLPDGTAVDLVFNFASLHRRVDFGQIREAVLGRIAHTTGYPQVVPPFAAPDETTIKAMLKQAGLPESGMQTLLNGKNGDPLEQASTVGWVYWGRLWHLAKGKLHTFSDGTWGQVQGEMENFILRDIGALEIVREALNIRSVRRADADSLHARIVDGPVAQADAPTPLFFDLQKRLRIGGIDMVLDGDRVRFSKLPPQPGNLELAKPVPHPWLRDWLLEEVGVEATEVLPQDYAALVEANKRVSRLQDGNSPQKLVDDAYAQLNAGVQALFEQLLTKAHLRFSGRLNFSARTVLVPAVDLTLEQVGLPEDMAWDLFAPLVTRELGDADAVTTRTEKAAQVLDDVMAQNWVILNRAPTLEPTNLLAFHPVRVPGYAIHLHPMVCAWLNADFDGDQAAIMLPITAESQREAGELLTVAGHLRRDPALLNGLLPHKDALWGLAWLSQKAGGLAEIKALLDAPVQAPCGFVTRATLADALTQVLARDGVDVTQSKLQALMDQGFAAAKASGASFSPFVESGALISEPPADNSRAAWDVYTEDIAQVLTSPADCLPAHLEPQCLMVRAADERAFRLALYLAGRSAVKTADGQIVTVRHSYTEGLSADEIFACVAGARKGIAQLHQRYHSLGSNFRERNITASFHTLNRAMRSPYPGVVFARAADGNVVDPLTDVEARLLVGL